MEGFWNVLIDGILETTDSRSDCLRTAQDSMVRTFGVRRKQNAFDEAACHDQLELCSLPAMPFLETLLRMVTVSGRAYAPSISNPRLCDFETASTLSGVHRLGCFTE
jgi:hypothetical protein